MGHWQKVHLKAYEAVYMRNICLLSHINRKPIIIMFYSKTN